MKKYLVMLLLASLSFGLTAREDENKRAISHGQDALLTIKVTGTRGGHSGDDIGRTGSALTILVDLLFPIDNLRLVSLSTNNTRGNVIPSDCEATVLVPKTKVNDLKRAAAQMEADVASNPFYVDVSGHGLAPVISVTESIINTAISLSSPTSRRVLNLIGRLPTGAQVIDNLGVKFSSNLAWIKLDAQSSTFSALLSTRYNDLRLLEHHKARLDYLITELGAKVTHKSLYSPWVATDNPENDELCKMSKHAHESFGNGSAFKFKRVHAGLELQAVVSYSRPTVRSISLGADISDAHSENEKLRVDSVNTLYSVVGEVMRSLSKAPATDLKQHYVDRGGASTTLFADQICPIPRPSNSPDRIVMFLERYAKDHSLAFERDAAQNVLIRSPGTCGVNKPFIVLHAHHDMVVVGANAAEVLKRGVKPVWFQEQGIRFLKGDRSSLGADNGIGVAVGLTLLTDPRLCHGELAFLITASEEDGFVGAKNLGQNMRNVLQAADVVISLDGFSSSEGEIGSAGYMDHVIELAVQRSK